MNLYLCPLFNQNYKFIEVLFKSSQPVSRDLLLSRFVAGREWPKSIVAFFPFCFQVFFFMFLLYFCSIATSDLRLLLLFSLEITIYSGNYISPVPWWPCLPDTTDSNASLRNPVVVSIYFILSFLVENVEHLLKLSDEYQVKGIFDPCVKFLQNQQKTEENVIKIVMLATLYKLNEVRESCYTAIRNMKLQSILKATQQQSLDKITLQNVLSQRIERLETFLERLYPQFIGVVECCFWLWHSASKQQVKFCPLHFSGGKSYSADLDERLKECPVCKKMLLTLVEKTKTHSHVGLSRQRELTYNYGGNLHFDEDLSILIQEFSELMKHWLTHELYRL